MVTVSADMLKRALCDLTMVQHGDEGLLIDLAQIYHTGDVVTVVARPETGGFYVHDGGGAAMALETSGMVIKPRLYEYLKDRVASYQCEFEGFRVSKRCEDVDKLAATVAIVGCASRLVADYTAPTEPPPLFDFRRQLVDRMHDHFGAPRIRENEEVTAATGTRYHVSAVLLDPAGNRPLAYVEAIGNHAAVTRKFRTFYDLAKTPLVNETSRVAVYDSARAGISQGDVMLLENVSKPISYQDSEALWATLQ